MFPPEDAEPPLFQDAVRLDAELPCGTYYVDGRIFHPAGWHEGFECPTENERIDQLFLLVQCSGGHAGDNDRVVICRLLCADVAWRRGKVRHFGVLAEFLAGKNLFHDSGQRVIYIPCQQAAGGTRIGDQFLFVQALGDILYLYGCQVVVTVRILLKFGQVVGSRCPDVLALAADRRDTCVPYRLAVTVQF